MQPEPDRFFPATYDSTTKIVSALIFVVLALVAAVVQNLIVSWGAALVLILAYGYSPRGYFCSRRSIVVKRLLRNVQFPLEGVREVRRATQEDFRGAIRLWGDGGLFGYYGLFRTSTLGKCTWYVTNRSHAVVAITETRTALFSPDDVEGFVALAGATAPAAGVLATPPYEAGGGGRKWVAIGGVVGALVAGLVLLSLLWSPGAPKYTLTSDRLTIHDRFYPVTLSADGVDVAHIPVIDVESDPVWRPVARTNGFANLHYRAGWFRVAGGQKVRMYRADGRRLVLLPPKGDGTPVLFETQNPDQFAAEMRQFWSTRP